MGLYEKWCESIKENDERKYYWTYVEKDGGRDDIREDLAETIRSHYERLERIADDVGRLGYKVAAKILREAMPNTPKGRSGDLGEILATELVEEEIGLRVPVRRLRYKDGRNMAMRGDDIIGAGYQGNKLWLLKVKLKVTRSLAKPRSPPPARSSTATMAAARLTRCCSSPIACWRATTLAITHWVATFVTKWVLSLCQPIASTTCSSPCRVTALTLP